MMRGITHRRVAAMAYPPAHICFISNFVLLRTSDSDSDSDFSLFIIDVLFLRYLLINPFNNQT